MSVRAILQLSAIFIVSVAILACGTATPETNDDDVGGFDLETDGPDGQDGFDAELFEIVDRLGLGMVSVSRSKDGIHLSIYGLTSLHVGETASYKLNVWNYSRQYAPETPFDITSGTADLLSAGPVTTRLTSDWNDKLLRPGHGTGAYLAVTCNDEGSAVITGNVKGQSHEYDPARSYSVSVDFPMKCVNDSEATRIAALSEDGKVAVVRRGDTGIPVGIASVTSGGSCDDYSWESTLDPVTALLFDIGNGITDVGEWSGTGDACGFGTVDDADIVHVDLESEGWSNYCDAVASEHGDGMVDLFLDCGDGTETVSLDGSGGGGEDSPTRGEEIVDSTAPTQPPLASIWSGLVANRNTTSDTYNLGTKEDELPYWWHLFRVEKPHTGCDVEHIHSDQTIYAFENWSRGSSGWKTNPDSPRDDPAPDDCGYGSEVELNGRPVAIDGQSFIELCMKLEFDGISANMRRHCNIAIDAITQ